MNKKNIFEMLNFDEKEQHGLHGHVRVSIKNNDTGEVSLWEESDNIIPISGYQWILMKMFGLHLDSIHNPSVSNYEHLDQDTTVAIPDLNNDNSLSIGVRPTAYSTMVEEISADHIVQGFMVGDGGANEDGNTTKNTDYSFVSLRNPIPFQETQSTAKLNSSIANKYLGDIHETDVSTGIAKGHAYYIKKFDTKPKIYHSWYKDGQSWDAVDPVTQSQLGPRADVAVSRIESYVQCTLSIDSTDCMAYFGSTEGSNRTPRINELGLVSFNTIRGQRSIAEDLHDTLIKPMLLLIFDKTYIANPSAAIDATIKRYASSIITVLTSEESGVNIASFENSRINAFIDTLTRIKNTTADTIDHQAYMNELSNPEKTNVCVTAYYDQTNAIQYTVDDYLEILASASFDEMTTDEAERIKLITCYTFASIPLEENTSILFDYRIYAN